MEKNINEYLNLNHLVESKKIIQKEEKKIYDFENRFFEEHLLTREQVLDFLTDEDLKKFSVYGLSVKEYLDLADKDKFIGNEEYGISDGQGKYIINRKEKTIHTFRFPSADPYVTDFAVGSLILGKDSLIFTHTRSYNNLYAHTNNKPNDAEQFVYNFIRNRRICEARKLAATFYVRETFDFYSNKKRMLPDIVGYDDTIQRDYYFDIKTNTFDKAHLWRKQDIYGYSSQKGY